MKTYLIVWSASTIKEIVNLILSAEPKLKHLFTIPDIIVNKNKTISIRVNEVLVFKVNTNSKRQLFGVRKNMATTLESLGIKSTMLKSDTAFCYFSSSVFTPLSTNLDKIYKVLCKYASELLVGEAFGCCSRYIECSDAKHCIHPDQIHAQGYIYRKNLLSGKIFYGKNANI